MGVIPFVGVCNNTLFVCKRPITSLLMFFYNYSALTGMCVSLKHICNRNINNLNYYIIKYDVETPIRAIVCYSFAREKLFSVCYKIISWYSGMVEGAASCIYFLNIWIFPDCYFYNSVSARLMTPWYSVVFLILDLMPFSFTSSKMFRNINFVFMSLYYSGSILGRQLFFRHVLQSDKLCNDLMIRPYIRGYIRIN